MDEEPRLVFKAEITWLGLLRWSLFTAGCVVAVPAFLHHDYGRAGFGVAIAGIWLIIILVAARRDKA
jgi:hypothetical protein